MSSVGSARGRLSDHRPVGLSDSPSLKDVLRRAADWVQRFSDDSMFVVAEERYEQEYRSKEGRSWSTERRELLSEIVTVRTPEEELRAGYPWVQFRDVLEVDGKPLPDHRGRLESLFREGSTSGYSQASALVKESASFNIGPGIRTVNVPSFALFFLHARNQRRLRFEVGQVGQVGLVGPPDQPNPPMVVRCTERQRPTMIRTPNGKDLPATGVFWIEPASGRVLKTRLEVKMSAQWVLTIEVTYGYDAGIDAWVPQAMREHFGAPAASGAGSRSTPAGQGLADAGDVLDCTATYSNYRRFRTSGRVIVK